MNASIIGSGSLQNAFRLRNFERRRASSYDRTGGNKDYFLIAPGERRVVFDEAGPGCITHIWTTQLCLGEKYWLRNVIVRIWWDGEESPSVECPLGDFFGLGHGERIDFVSAPLQMSPQKGKGFNSWWPMPFKRRARIEIENDAPGSWVPEAQSGTMGRLPGLIFYYYVDYERYGPEVEGEFEDAGYFHAQFRRVDYRKDMLYDRDTKKRMGGFEWQFDGGKNTRANGGYDENHVILEAEGAGQYLGCHIDITNRWRWTFNWPGEGDDMIFIDDDVGGEPTLYGTGTEDYVNTAFCPQEKYSAPYHGIIKGGGPNWLGKISYYRYHVQDPIPFKRRILVSIEHGHNNTRGDIWETTAYWYQKEPHSPSYLLPGRAERGPR
jgi:hypothetical protein